MSDLFAKISKYFLYTLFTLIFLGVMSQLFFEKDTRNAMSFVRNLFVDKDVVVVTKIDNLRVVYPDEPLNLEPTFADPTTRQRLSNIYEPLVKTDRDLKIKPALAVNWGLIDDYTWEFRLRPDVKFHDGSPFDSLDVKKSIDRAIYYPSSELVGIVSTIDKIEIKDGLTLQIKTKEPDPLLLQRLAMILIVPSEYQDKELPQPVGTGSYKFKTWEKGEKIVLEKFDGYWGEKAKFKTVEMYSRIDKFERVQMLIDDKADLLAFVPYDGVEYVQENGFKIATIPSLEVQFLLFNMKSKLLNDVRNRVLVSVALNQSDLIEAVGGYARSVSQFVGSGIFGFNPYIPDHVYDVEAAKNLAEMTQLKGKTLQFHLIKGLTVLGEYVRTKLAEAGVNVIVSYLDDNELLDSMKKGKADIYFMGFESGIGDASTFLYFIAYSKGPYAFWGYENEYVDKLIVASLTEMDALGRRKDLQEAMKVLVVNDVLGVPLFEYESVYAFNDKVDINPRIDGIIYFDELIVK